MSVYRTELTPLLLLERSMRVHGPRIAATYGQRRFTWEELGTRVRRLAAALAGTGLRPGDRVAVLAPNVPAMLEAHFGVALAGGVLVAINTRLNAAEVSYILEHSGARILLVDAELAQPLGTLPRVCRARRHDRRSRVRSRRVAHLRRARVRVLPRRRAQHGAVPRHGRGGALLDQLHVGHHRAAEGRHVHASRRLPERAGGDRLPPRWTPTSVFLWTLPMFHCNGWCFPWAVTGAGARHVLLRKVDPPLVWRLIAEEGVTHFNGAPTVLIMLINDPSAPAGRLARPLRIATGGAPPSPTLLRAVGGDRRRADTPLRADRDVRPAHHLRLAPGVGRPRRGGARQTARPPGRAHLVACELRVVDADMQRRARRRRDAGRGGDARQQRDGRLLRATPSATAQAFRGGWFHSGDLGVMHPDGYIELRDRKKDIIISGGENISTIEVEQAIASHPDVLEVAVIAIPDDQWGEVPKAFVTLKEGRSPGARGDRRPLPGASGALQVPQGDRVRCRCPKTSTGKVQKFVLRERAWAGRDTRIH